MEIAEVFSQYLEHLFAGKRSEAREMIHAALDRGMCAQKLIRDVVWPAMEQIEALYRKGRINRLVEHMATRINRTIADQLQAHMARKPKMGLRLLVVCGEGESEELGGQMAGDLFEAEGWSVWFLGSGVPNDEVLQLTGKLRPDVLCIYGTRSVDVAGIRGLIDMVRENGAYDQMQILVAGGIFNRATGLDEEIRADLCARDARGALSIVQEHPVRVPRPDLPQPGRRRKRKHAPAHNTGARRKAQPASAAP